MEIYSLDEKEKGRVIHSMRIGYSVRDHGPITKIFYNSDVGLIVSTFKGMLQVYDSMEFKMLWETANTAQRKEKITITTFDYSQKAGLIAVGGVDGRIAIFDPSAKILTAQTKAHEGSEVMDVYFYDKQMQLITIGIDRSIMLWDSLKLECVQIIKDSSP